MGRRCSFEASFFNEVALTQSPKPPKTFRLNDQDREVWEHYSGTVKQLKKSERLPHKKAPKAKIKIEQDDAFEIRYIPKPLSSKRNKNPVHFQARLDLHGMTQDQAYEKLIDFLAQCRARDFKCVLIITGKGRPRSMVSWENEVILKDLVPRWLNEEPNRVRVRAYEQADLQNGGDGALYVFLNRV